MQFCLVEGKSQYQYCTTTCPDAQPVGGCNLGWLQVGGLYLLYKLSWQPSRGHGPTHVAVLIRAGADVNLGKLPYTRGNMHPAAPHLVHDDLISVAVDFLGKRLPALR